MILLLGVATCTSSCSMYLDTPGDRFSVDKDGSQVHFQVMKEVTARQWYITIWAYGEKGTHTRARIENCKIHDSRGRELLSMKPFDLKFSGSVGGMPNQVGTGMTYSNGFKIPQRSRNPITIRFNGIVYSRNGTKTLHQGEFQFGPDLMGYH